MTVIDANVLLYAYNADAPQQTTARWPTELLESRKIVALPSLTIWAFLRICTNPEFGSIHGLQRRRLPLLQDGPFSGFALGESVELVE